MGKEINVPRAEDETAAELKRIFAQAVLSVPGLLGSAACGKIVAAHQVEKRCHLEACLAVRSPAFVDEQREGNAGGLLEVDRVTAVSQTDRGDRSSCVADPLFVVAQLRDVLAAEDSAVMA